MANPIITLAWTIKCDRMCILFSTKKKKKKQFKVITSKVYFLLSKLPASSSRALHELFQDILCIKDTTIQGHMLTKNL